jgi:hypothetical protein
MVLARGRIVFDAAFEAGATAAAAAAATLPATLFFRARLWPGATPVVDSRRLRGREAGVELWCSFCW